MPSPAVAVAFVLAGFLLAMAIGALIWVDSERAARRERIERARRREHSKVPVMHWGQSL